MRAALTSIGLAAVLASALTAAPAAAGTAADLSILKTAAPNPVAAGSSLVYTLTVSNKGPSDAAGVVVDDALPAGTTFTSLAAPAGWSCTDPGAGNNGAVSCTAATLPPGSVVLTLTVTVGAGVVNGTVLGNTATVASSTPDPNPGSESATADVTVVSSTVAVSLTKSDSPDPVLTGDDLTYTLTASNNGGTDLEQAVVSDTLPAGTTFVSLTPPAGWTCSQPAVGSGGAVSCSAAPFAPGGAVFTLVVKAGSGLAGGTVLANQADLTVTDSGRDTTLAATATTQVLSPAAVSAAKSVSGSFSPGGSITYTVVLTNASAHNQGDNPGNEFVDVLPSQLTLLSATATSGTAIATPATRTVTWNGAIAAGGAVTITIQAMISAAPPGSTVTNQGTAFYDADGNGTNEASALTNPASFQVAFIPIQQIPTLDPLGLALFLLLLAGLGAVFLRRRSRQT